MNINEKPNWLFEYQFQLQLLSDEISCGPQQRLAVSVLPIHHQYAQPYTQTHTHDVRMSHNTIKRHPSPTQPLTKYVLYMWSAITRIRTYARWHARTHSLISCIPCRSFPLFHLSTADFVFYFLFFFFLVVRHSRTDSKMFIKCVNEN